jgi:hypothetical protein
VRGRSCRLARIQQLPGNHGHAHQEFEAHPRSSAATRSSNERASRAARCTSTSRTATFPRRFNLGHGRSAGWNPTSATGSLRGSSMPAMVMLRHPGEVGDADSPIGKGAILPAARTGDAVVLNQFRAALVARGIVPPDSIVADGRLHRCDAAGPRGRGDAAYLLHLDGVPAGGMENWRDGRGWETWRPDASQSPHPAQREASVRLDSGRERRSAMLKPPNGTPMPDGLRRVSGRTHSQHRPITPIWRANGWLHKGCASIAACWSYRCATWPGTCIVCNSSVPQAPSASSKVAASRACAVGSGSYRILSGTTRRPSASPRASPQAPACTRPLVTR